MCTVGLFVCKENDWSQELELVLLNNITLYIFFKKKLVDNENQSTSTVNKTGR